jgi:hypothetical protein
MFTVEIKRMLLTSVSAVWSRGSFCLNLPIQTAGQFVLGVIVPIPLHTPNIMPICNSSRDFKLLTKKVKCILRSIIGGNSKMLKEKYTKLFLSHQTGGITTIGVTHKLYAIQKL